MIAALLALTDVGAQEPADDEDWRHRAACVEEDPELFFPLGDTPAAKRQTAEAKFICWSACPVRKECLAWAIDGRHEDGVWGGLSELQRRRLRRANQRTHHTHGGNK